MKREYEKPEVEVIELVTEVITVEGGAGNVGDAEGGFENNPSGGFNWT